MKYHIPKGTLAYRKFTWSMHKQVDADWDSFVTSKAVTYKDSECIEPRAENEIYYYFALPIEARKGEKTYSLLAVRREFVQIENENLDIHPDSAFAKGQV